MIKFDGQALKRIRQEKLISQNELAKRAGVNLSLISALENDDSRCHRPSSYRKIIEALGYSLNDNPLVTFYE